MNDKGSIYVDFTFQSGATGTGVGTAAQVLHPDYGALTGLTLNVQGITTATVDFQANIDGTNWVPVDAVNLTTSVAATQVTADGMWRLNCGGLYQVRANITAHTTGTITITGIGYKD